MSFDFDRFSAPVSFEVMDSLNVRKLLFRGNEPPAHEFAHGAERYVARGYTNEDGITAECLNLAVKSCVEIAVNHKILLPGFITIDDRKGRAITVSRVVEGDKVEFFRHGGNDDFHRLIGVFRDAYSKSPAYSQDGFSIGLTNEPSSYALVGLDMCFKFNDAKRRINSVIQTMEDLGLAITEEQKCELRVEEGNKLGWDPEILLEEAPRPRLYLVRLGRILTPETKRFL